MARVLIIDDDPDFCYALGRVVGRMQHDTLSCGSIGEARTIMAGESFEAVFLDVLLPDGNGLTLLPELGKLPDQPETIIITGAGDSEGAEMAISNGAWDYINKSASAKDITLILKRALQYRQEKLLAADTAAVALRRDAIIGSSPRITECFDQVAQCALSDVNVVITGETGTGKELFARAIHDNSTRSGKPFVVVDCASLSETLTESLLFGHKKGAFTGADSNRKGLVLEAEGGTLFLDEIGELPFATQKSFLRVLQERTIRPVGSGREIHCDFRLVAATNRNLDEMVTDHTFRKDLFFRLQAVHIQLPPLRDRSEDVAAIATFHINRLCEEMGYERKGISRSFFESLSEYSWPGNVRELVNCLAQTIVAAGQEPTIYPKHLPNRIRIVAKRATFGKNGGEGEESETPLSSNSIDGDIGKKTLQEYRDSVLAKAEQNYLQSVLQTCDGNIQMALKISGLSQSRFYALLKKYAIRPGLKK